MINHLLNWTININYSVPAIRKISCLKNDQLEGQLKTLGSTYSHSFAACYQEFYTQSDICVGVNHKPVRHISRIEHFGKNSSCMTGFGLQPRTKKETQNMIYNLLLIPK